MPVSAIPRSASAAAFFGLTYLISWSIFLPAAAGAQGWLPLDVPLPLLLLGGYGPALAALILVGLRCGWVGVGELLGRLLLWRFGLGWYAVILLAPTAFLLVGIGVHLLLGGQLPDLANPPLLRSLGPAAASLGPWLFLAVVFVQQFLGLIGEELGWRGYALPVLQRRCSALAASLFLGLLWGVWHLPLILTPATRSGVADLPIGWFLADILATSIFYTWVYNGTGGSLLSVTLLHTVNNTAAVFLPITELATQALIPFLAVVAARWLVALILVLATGPAHLSRRPPSENPYFDRVVT